MITNLFKRCALLMLGTLLCTIMQGQAKDDLFKPRYETTKVKSFRSTFTHSDSIALDALGTIYAFAIDATITQPRESSFVRVVLEDKEGNQYLVAECDRFRYDQDEVRLEQFCQETAALIGIIPACLKCYVAGDATIQITGIHNTSTPPTRGVITEAEKNEVRKEQVQSVVERINAYNKKHGKLWVAGTTPISLMNLSERMQLFGKQVDCYSGNIEYYSGGIFEFPETRYLINLRDASAYIESFDWTNRHGKNWITPIRYQYSKPYCTAFAVAAGVEAMRNLYFNIPDTSFLSVQQIACCAKYNPNPINTSLSINVDSALIYSRDIGIMPESFYPFDVHEPQICMSDYKEPNEIINITDYSSQQWYNVQSDTLLKWRLINKGPLVSWIIASKDSYGDKNFNHAMLLVGYGQIEEGMKIPNYHPNLPHEDEVIPADDPRIGMTYWKFKNSWGYSYNNGYVDGTYDGYMYMFIDTLSIIKQTYSIQTPIVSQLLTDMDIVCEDTDGDGYFNWGIGPRPNDRLPAWAEQEEDGDDSNRFKGSMDTYGYLDDITYPITAFVVDHNMTDTELADSLGGRFIRRPVRLNQGVTLTVTGELAFYKHRGINMSKNSTLVIDGGKLVDLKLGGSGTGRTVRIINGGTIECLKEEQFQLPPTISLEMDEGEIK